MNIFWMSVYFNLAIFSTTLFATQVEPSLSELLDENSDTEVSTIFTVLPPGDLTHLKSAPLSERSKIVIDALESNLTKHSKKLMALINSGLIKGVTGVTPLWIINSIRVRAKASAIRKLIATNEATRITLDSPQELDSLDYVGNTPKSHSETVAWGVAKIDAPKVWKLGFMGQGVTVALIDSGINKNHPDLSQNIWKNPGETGVDETGKNKETNAIDDDTNGYIDDVMGWNFIDDNNDLSDSLNHGSQAAGIIAGNGTKGIKTGVAPQSKLMVLKSCCTSDTDLFESDTWEAMQYAIKNGAKIISMSLTLKPHSHPSYAKWRQASEVLLLAGIIHINSSGNTGDGMEPNNLGAPATNPPPWKHPLQVSLTGQSSTLTVGATNEDDEVQKFSSSGPVTWEGIEGYLDFPYSSGDKRGLIKPDICAPSGVPSTQADSNDYGGGFGGTSSATPHVAGVAALLLSAIPKLTPEELTEIIQMSAVRVQSPFNNKCGAGRVDAGAAIKYAISRFLN